jgi:hypothetical protein
MRLSLGRPSPGGGAGAGAGADAGSYERWAAERVAAHSQKGVDESLQLSIYALACRDTLGLGTPERVTLYFTESATRLSTARSDEQLDAARSDILARTARIRSGDFAATPSPNACQRCDYASMCPSRVS